MSSYFPIRVEYTNGLVAVVQEPEHLAEGVGFKVLETRVETGMTGAEKLQTLVQAIDDIRGGEGNKAIAKLTDLRVDGKLPRSTAYAVEYALRNLPSFWAHEEEIIYMLGILDAGRDSLAHAVGDSSALPLCCE